MVGTGILKGMVETARNFVGSYVDEARLTTVEYPEERIPLQEATRQFPFLVFDGSDPQAGLRCVACQICEKECPPQCISIQKSKDKKPDYLGKPQFYPAVFDIERSTRPKPGKWTSGSPRKRPKRRRRPKPRRKPRPGPGPGWKPKRRPPEQLGLERPDPWLADSINCSSR